VIESALIIIRRYPAWIEAPTSTSNANRVFQFDDALLTIFPDGGWTVEQPLGIEFTKHQGTINNLETFLEVFAAANP